ncbi:Cryptochrome-2, partial [Bienertia sinuspersici]
LKVRRVARNTILRYCLLEHERLMPFFRESLSELDNRSRILNFRYFSLPIRGVDIYLFVVGLIKEWGLESKVFLMTCDNASAMDVMMFVGKLRIDCLKRWNSVYLMLKRVIEAKKAL